MSTSNLEIFLRFNNLLISDISVSSQVLRTIWFQIIYQILLWESNHFSSVLLFRCLKLQVCQKGFSDQLERDGSLSKQHFLSLSPWKR